MGYGHGQRGRRFTARKVAFRCRVCCEFFPAGSSCIGFKNLNRAAPNDWDHTCGEDCAAKYEAPPRAASSSGCSIVLAVAGAISRLTRREAQPRPVPTLKFSELPGKLGASRDEAVAALWAAGGHEDVALVRLGTAMLACDGFGEREDDRAIAPVACGVAAEQCSECSPGESDDASVDELRLFLAAWRMSESLSSIDAQAAAHDMFMKFVKPLILKPPIDERPLIRSPTAQAIQQEYERMATNQATFVASAAAIDASLLSLAADATGDAEVSAGDTQSGVVREQKRRKQSGELWKERVQSGEWLVWEAIDGLGAKPLRLYLRAMGVKVTKQVKRDTALAQDLARSELRKRGLK